MDTSEKTGPDYYRAAADLAARAGGTESVESTLALAIEMAQHDAERDAG